MQKKSRKFIIFSLLGVLTSVSVISTAGMDNHQAVLAQSEQASSDTRKMINDETSIINLPEIEDWSHSTPSQQASLIVKYINQMTLQDELLTLELFTDYLPEPEEIEELEGFTYYHYYLENDAESVALQLAVEQNDQDRVVTNGLAQVEQKTAENVQLEEIQIEEMREILVEDYTSENHTQLESAQEVLGLSATLSYIGNFDIYHYLSEDGQEVALLVIDDQVAAFNEINQDDTLTQQPFEQTKQKLDRLSHEDGLNRQEVVAMLGHPHDIYYDSVEGIITYAWHSTVDPDVSTVSYMFAYNGIGIGLYYN
ncbi:hypothetical protein HYO62_05360 [Aerococcaceae bacterium DSM 111022]|nr:hypothetical protein [Aerococcaceae bacterium DSM 111022]